MRPKGGANATIAEYGVAQKQPPTVIVLLGPGIARGMRDGSSGSL